MIVKKYKPWIHHFAAESNRHLARKVMTSEFGMPKNQHVVQLVRRKLTPSEREKPVLSTQQCTVLEAL